MTMKYDVTLYPVWRPEVGETRADARELGAFDVPSAARVSAAYLDRENPSTVWPHTFHVTDPKTGKTFAVKVERRFVADFVAHEAVPVNP